MIKGIIILFAVVLLISCISPTPYQKSSSNSTDGFSITKVSGVEYQISFYGNDETGQQRANDYVMLRAAQEASNNGYPFFTILRKKSTSTTQEHAYNNDHNAPIQVVNRDGSVTSTTDYNARFGSSSKRYSTTKPKVYILVKFLEDDYDQENVILNSNEVITKLSSKYQIKISTSAAIK